ncbi:dihydrofolate reductase family protein [Alkalihalobacillus oceani]|uniref:dihydrofolate reductase family protein n=1 Tax=Halalkalibacter oceani TaxID=1653776 RepID=UPI00203E96E3|nr:dihydrofolate reductase family protein [Halalkalibacter oceani]MCM3759785.1 dihydrofolate reductase family protein [Halalkalibacter oceani]
MAAFADLSISLDGFITGPNSSEEQTLGAGGRVLHEWVYQLGSWRERHGLDGGKEGHESIHLQTLIDRTGAVIIGRKMYDHGVRYWGSRPPFHVPVFVLTHEPRPSLEMEGGTTFIFWTDGLAAAYQAAKAAAGEKEISVGGGADVIQQCLAAGFLDELHLHIVPVLLGDGVRLFEHGGSHLPDLELTSQTTSGAVIHASFRVKQSKGVLQ